MTESDPYAGREQALVKHTVLKTYLRALAFKLAHKAAKELTLTYVDGFSGPWQHASEDLSDTSPGIALQVLDEVRLSMAQQGRALRVRCLFVEKDAAAHAELVSKLSRYPDIETRALHGTFEESIPSVTAFAAEGVDRFTFVFIDPKGWTGFALDRLKPIFGRRSEVLVNFMTKDIVRFPSDQASARSMRELFGGTQYESCVAKTGLDREDCLVETYCRAVERILGFKYCTNAVVLHPLRDRTHYHLIYATNSVFGLDAFREAEAKAMQVQDSARGAAKRRQEEQREPGQLFVFGPLSLGVSYSDELAERYAPRARQVMEDMLQPNRIVPYDVLAAAVLLNPMTTRSALNGWLDTLRKSGKIEYVGLAEGARRPRLGQGHRLAVKP